MKRSLTFFILLLFGLAAFAQNVTRQELDKEIKPLKDKIKVLQRENSNLKKDLGYIKNKLGKANIMLDSLKIQTEANSDTIEQRSNELGQKITTTGEAANEKIKKVGYTLSKNSLFGIILVLSAILLTIFLYWLLSKRQKSDKTDMISKLTSSRSEIEEKIIREFDLLLTGIRDQMKLLKILVEDQKETAGKIDHTLPLMFADNISKMQMNLTLIDRKAKGYQQLTREINAVLENFKANNYEIVELLGKSFRQGSDMVVTMRPNPMLQSNEMMITQIIKPQVNYKGAKIQTAEVVVDYGE